jgi:hypothetical protein
MANILYTISRILKTLAGDARAVRSEYYVSKAVMVGK